MNNQNLICGVSEALPVSRTEAALRLIDQAYFHDHCDEVSDDCCGDVELSDARFVGLH